MINSEWYVYQQEQERLAEEERERLAEEDKQKIAYFRIFPMTDSKTTSFEVWAYPANDVPYSYGGSFPQEQLWARFKEFSEIARTHLESAPYYRAPND